MVAAPNGKCVPLKSTYRTTPIDHTSVACRSLADIVAMAQDVFEVSAQFIVSISGDMYCTVPQRGLQAIAWIVRLCSSSAHVSVVVCIAETLSSGRKRESPKSISTIEFRSSLSRNSMFLAKNAFVATSTAETLSES